MADAPVAFRALVNFLFSFKKGRNWEKSYCAKFHLNSSKLCMLSKVLINHCLIVNVYVYVYVYVYMYAVITDFIPLSLMCDIIRTILDVLPSDISLKL